AHAGWRGLCDGVLEATLTRFAPGAALLAWLGPAIGPERFEVGPEVRAAFLERAGDRAAATEACFRPSPNPGRWLADLYALARVRLQSANVEVFGGGLCTFDDEQRFYSFRR